VVLVIKSEQDNFKVMNARYRRTLLCGGVAHGRCR
jgi:hypothetical protein